MSAVLARASLVHPATSAADLTGKEGYFVEASSGSVSICNAATDIPLGCIAKGEVAGVPNAIALPGTIVRVKCAGTAGTIALGTHLTVTATGTVIADAGSGARVQVAVALEAGANDALILARLIEPKSIAAA